MFELLFERGIEPILLLDPQSRRFVNCNQAAAHLLGLDTREKVLQASPAEWSPPHQPDGRDSVAAVADVVERVEREGGLRFEWLARRADGKDVPIEVTSTRINTDAGNLHVVFARDISKRKRAEAAWHESQQMLASVADNISEAIYRSDPQHRLTFVNQAYLSLFGYDSLAQLQALPREHLYVAPSVRSRLLELLARDGAFSQQEVEYVRRDGRRFWGLASARLIRDPHSGEVQYHVGAITDITERKQMEAELRASELRWRLLFEQSPLSIQIFAPDGRSLQVNRAWRKLFLLSLEEMAGFNVLKDPQLTACGVMPLVERAFAGQVVQIPPVPFELQLSADRADRGHRWIGAIMFPLLDAQGRVNEVVCIHEDFTERRRIDEELRQLNATLERRIAERTAELTASEARLRTLVEHAPEAIVVFDADTGKFVSANENAVRLYGVNREELLHLTPADVSPPFQPDGRPSTEAAREWIAAARSGGTPVFEWMHEHRNGRLIPCEVRLVRLPGEDRTLVRGSVTDYTERRRRARIQQATYQISEAVLAADDLKSLYARIHESVMGLMPARNFYLALREAGSDVFTFPYFVDERDAWPGPLKLDTGLTGYVLRAGKPLLVNRQTPIEKQAVGLASLPEEGQGAKYIEHGAPAAVWLGVPLVIGGQAVGVMAVQDYQNERAYGEEEKQILTFVAEQTALAIERKRAERAVRDSESRFRALFEATNQGVLLHDDEKIFAVNPAAVRLLGFTKAEDVLGKHPADISAPIQPGGLPALDLARRHIATALAEGGARFEWLARRADGREFPLEVFLTTIESGGRKIIQSVFHDITHRKRAEAELLRTLAREKELGQLKSNFVSMVSHEFRTPLGIILSSAEILETYFDQLDAEGRRQHLQSIQKSTRRMGTLMEEVLVLSRFEAGKMHFHPAPLNLRTLCQRVADEVSSATSRECPITLTLDPEALTAEADERLLRHIFTNLLSNAVKYSPPGEAVEFSVARSGGEAICIIRDRGIGIPEEDRPWLFEAFHRGRNVGDRPGTGLGLVIVKRCVELHGGTLQVESRLGEGTAVTVRVPVFGPPPSGPPGAASQLSPPARPA